MKAKRFDEIFVGPMSPLRNLFLENVKLLGSLRNVAKIRDQVFDLIFSITTAERAAIFVDHTLTTRGRENREESVSINRAIIDRVLKSGPGVLVNEPPTSILCLPMDTLEDRVGVIYAESSNPQKPLNEVNFDMLTGVAVIVAMAVDHVSIVELLRADNTRLKEEADLRHDLVGESPAMTELQKIIAKVAPTNSNVLIQGESGTGKELVARAIHRNSNRSDKPFVAVNCAALAESLLESELFGHERGAFTGATALKKGQFELAHGGTLFLDEVGELALPLQSKLLRALQEREIKRVGGEAPIRVDVRLIAATNRKLEEAAEANEFREDLLYRLKVVAIKTPTLRLRREDIPKLAQHFVQKYGREVGRMVRKVSPEAEAVLVGYDWPGNVRELQNVMERAIVLGSSDTVLPEDLPEELLQAAGVVAGLSKYEEEVRNFKRDLITKAFLRAGGDYKKAAKILGRNPTTLYRLLHDLNLTHLLK